MWRAYQFRLLKAANCYQSGIAVDDFTFEVSLGNNGMSFFDFNFPACNGLVIAHGTLPFPELYVYKQLHEAWFRPRN